MTLFVLNEIDGQKNQVYTRSLHAEENAFLQASKYGNHRWTASPCFLCAYQLGIKRVVYIDISNEIGSHDIEVVWRIKSSMNLFFHIKTN